MRYDQEYQGKGKKVKQEKYKTQREWKMDLAQEIYGYFADFFLHVVSPYQIYK